MREQQSEPAAQSPYFSKERLALPPLYAIVNVDSEPNPLGYLEQLVVGGTELLQLRAKSWDEKKFEEFCKKVLQLLAELREKNFHSPGIVINDSVAIAVALPVAGVHLGQDDFDVHQARARLGPKKLIGLSTHSLNQVRQAQNAPIDYLAFGPIFSTASKVNPDPVVGVPLLERIARETPHPVVAIGGITLERAEDIFRLGAESIAVISDLSKATDLPDRIRAYGVARERVRSASSVRRIT